MLKRLPTRLLALAAGLLGVAMVTSCHSSMSVQRTDRPSRDINAVLADHDRQLLAKPGVVGVYVGLLADEKTPCLKVMLARPDRALERSLPKSIEGYRVLTEISGEIRPMD